MEAYELRSYDGPGGLHRTEAPEPTPGPDEALVAVEAIGVNFPDLLMTQGLYQLRPELPVVPGCELAGRIVTPPAEGGWQVGDRVAAFVWQGAYAARAVVPARSLLPLREGTSCAEGAAMAVNAHTALFALERRGRLQAGERVLVLGGAGGVGTAATAVAIGLGAEVIAGVSRASRVSTARLAGASEVVLTDGAFAAEVRELTGGRGVDLVIDPVGGAAADEAVRALAVEGRFVVVGFASGDIPSFTASRLLFRNVEVIGAAYGAFADLEHSLPGRQQRTLNEMVDRGVVLSRVDRRAGFDELPATLEALAAGEIAGKAVIDGPAQTM